MSINLEKDNKNWFERMREFNEGLPEPIKWFVLGAACILVVWIITPSNKPANNNTEIIQQLESIKTDLQVLELAMKSVKRKMDEPVPTPVVKAHPLLGDMTTFKKKALSSIEGIEKTLATMQSDKKTSKSFLTLCGYPTNLTCKKRSTGEVVLNVHSPFGTDLGNNVIAYSSPSGDFKTISLQGGDISCVEQHTSDDKHTTRVSGTE